MDLYYIITEDGFYIKDKNDDTFSIHQYEPYIKNHNISYEENAQNMIDELIEQEKSVKVRIDKIESLRADVDYLMLLSE